jgi:hypothetical protein
MTADDKDKAAEIVGSFPQNPDPIRPPQPIPQSGSAAPPVQPKGVLPEVPDAGNEVASNVAIHHK